MVCRNIVYMKQPPNVSLCLLVCSPHPDPHPLGIPDHKTYKQNCRTLVAIFKQMKHGPSSDTIVICHMRNRIAMRTM
jgi:hypothetical protein